MRLTQRVSGNAVVCIYICGSKETAECNWSSMQLSIEEGSQLEPWLSTNPFDELQDAVEPSVRDYQLPEAIERMAAETIEFQKQQKAFKDDLEVLKAEAMELEEESLLLTTEMQNTQITNVESELFTKERLAATKKEQQKAFKDDLEILKEEAIKNY